MPPNSSDTQTAADQATRHLRAHFRIEPHPETDCVLLESGSTGCDVRQNITCGDNCCVETTDEDGDERFLRGEVNGRCICPVFTAYECVATIDGFDGEELAISISMADRETLSEIVSSIRDVGATVRLQRISQSGDDRGSSIIELTTDSVTPKQHQAVRTAVERGYYETPRQTDLSELAAELDVSRSAISQRLNAVERKLVSELFTAADGIPTEPPS